MKLHLAYSVLLVATTAAIYGQTVGFGSAPIDDALFVFENPFVRSGISWRNVSWAFSFETAASHANWTPLTFLSFMLDAELGSGGTAAFHFTNVCLHAANAVLVYAVFCRMTRKPHRSAIVAFFFAAHPLHVESVAWITERKDVLSIFFGLFSLWFYAGFASDRGRIAYLLSLTAFGLSLLSKQTLVTLPCVLLLLDYWPFGRFSTETRQGLHLSDAGPGRERRDRRDSLGRLLVEKLPYFVLTVVFCAIVLKAQHRAMGLMYHVPLADRLANAAVAYVSYLAKTIWPADLSVFYPHPRDGVPLGSVVLSSALLAAVSTAVVAYRRAVPHWFTGWFWFVGTLVPMIGVVQVGDQQMADRYTYFPHLGLFAAVAWSVPSADRHPAVRVAASALVSIAIVLCSLLAFRQATLWNDGVQLYRHGIAATGENATLHQFLASELHLRKQNDLALDHFRESERLNPEDPELQFTWGIVLMDLGQTEDAMRRFTRALELNTCHVRAHVQLGSLLEGRGEVDRAHRHYRAAVECDPHWASAQYNWGRVLTRRGEYDAASAHFRRALQLDPEHELAHTELGTALAVLGQGAEAAVHFRAALDLDPRLSQAHCNLALVLMSEGNLTGAIDHFQAALAIDPDLEPAQSGLAKAQAAMQPHN